MYVSFMCNLFLFILCTWYFSTVFKCFTFFYIFMTFIVSVILPCACPVFNIRFKYPELPLLFLIACMCSLYLVRNVWLVCLMYFSGQSIHFIWYTSLFSYLSICRWGFTMFCIVFLVWNAAFIYDSKTECTWMTHILTSITRFEVLQELNTR
jgi:hypothetical protein